MLLTDSYKLYIQSQQLCLASLTELLHGDVGEEVHMAQLDLYVDLDIERVSLVFLQEAHKDKLLLIGLGDHAVLNVLCSLKRVQLRGQFIE